MAVAVSMRGVGVTYGSHPALVDLNLDIGQGERVALVGPSGSGKSTFLRLCNGSVAPTEGTLQVLGNHLPGAAASELRALRRRVGTIHQQLHLVGSLRVIHNVNAGRLGSWSALRALRSLLRPLEVESTRIALAGLGIEDKLFERTDRLSGGEQQRVALARLLVSQPELILADEPVSSLDPARSDEVMSLLTTVVTDHSRTLVVSLHDFDVARRRCDRVVGLRAGQVAFDLPAADVTEALGRDLYRLHA